MKYNSCSLLIIAIIALLTCNIANCEDYLHLSANSTTIEIQNISPYDLDIGNLNVVRTDYNPTTLAKTGHILLYNNTSYFMDVDGLVPGNMLMLTSNNPFEVFGSCVVENN